ncbi:PAS domain-containing sensor histidine kinase [Caballeronia sp. LZ019]|uniref:PAS domain-containing sensor histidine kinase n=1 Tax=Caballeronia sp. LZ019 TaxID=3038555 RepID=UPI002866F710|nr:PAS domain-containing sensor histidine kinase [Caballeronia sp. LZ019]MDR5809061.1 PAS domain-containing sensor histidine kinase [Caballeronia sp. LZ019]
MPAIVPISSKIKPRPVLDEELIEALPVAVYVCDLDGVIVRYNRKAEELWGRSLGPADANMLYCGAYKLHLPDGMILPQDRAPMVEALRSGASFRNLEFQIEQPNGQRLWVLVNIDPLRDEAGTIVGAINCFQDVTEHKLAQEQKLRIDELNRSLQRQSEFLATVAHELRSPLAPVRSALEVMRRSSPGTDAEPMRAMIERQVAHMTRLIDDLIDGARVTAGKIELKKCGTDLRDIVDRGVELIRPQIDAANQELVVEVPRWPVSIVADAMRLTQVIGNLLGNATKFTPVGGRICVSLTVEDNLAVLSVSDDGIGIPSEKLPSIFEMFSQGEQACARDPGGLGIGLALTKRLVEMHDGNIVAESAGRGHGSNFVCRLPMGPSMA